MEMATNVRDFLVGVEESVVPDLDALLVALQNLHEKYLEIMNDFSAQVSELALSMSPEARVVAHQLRLRLYQDWRAKLMERIFNTEVTSPTMLAMSPLETDNNGEHDCDSDVCVCALKHRLDTYQKVIEEFLAASPKIKSHIGNGNASPENCKRVFEASDSNEFSDDGLADQCFMFPEFLRFTSQA